MVDERSVDGLSPHRFCNDDCLLFIVQATGASVLKLYEDSKYVRLFVTVKPFQSGLIFLSSSWSYKQIIDQA